jgi:hypothetical protein
MAYVEAAEQAARNALVQQTRPAPTPTLGVGGAVELPVSTKLPPLRPAFVEAFGDRWQYAFEVARCETGGFRPDVIYGPTRGSAGERGLFQLLSPSGVGDAFLAAGYADFFDPYQQIEFVAAYTAENGWLAWRGCLP